MNTIQPRRIDAEALTLIAETHRIAYADVPAGQAVRSAHARHVDRGHLLAHIAWLDQQVASKTVTIDSASTVNRDLRSEIGRLHEQLTLAGQEQERLRRALAAAVDDPSKDLPGTVRTGPDGVVVVRVAHDDTQGWPWRLLGGPSGVLCWNDADVVGWEFTQRIVGTAAWDAQSAEDAER